MNHFRKFCGKAKYLGLLGLPGILLPHKIWDFLWLFWLFGIIEIALNFSLFLQSLKQLWGMFIVPLYYGKNLPNKDNYCCQVKYSLPFQGSWTAVNGGTDKEFSHSWEIPTQRYAYDFIILDENGKSFTGDTKNAESYFCYGKEIISPANGEVIETGTGCPNSIITGNGRADCSASDIRGNYILIRHAKKEYSLLAHLKPGSILVKPGDLIRRGETIALCGNSGNSTEPHLHFQLQSGKSFYYSAGLPIEFENITVSATPCYSSFDPRPIPESGSPSEKYIARGQRLENKQI